MGFIKFKNGAAVTLEASWAINMLESKEASTTLCGTQAGAEIQADAEAADNKEDGE